MISVRDLHKAYGARVALDGVSFEVPRACCFGLLGPNGAGKTTAISIIAGTLDADRGSVSIGGLPVSIRELATKRLVGYVPQDLAIYEELSAHDNLRFFGLIYDLGGAALEQAIDGALTIAGLHDRKREPVRLFSGGMKRRLNIAVALLHDPQLLILDEPTVGVDPQSRNLIFETLESLRALGKTLIYTSHYMEEIERLCDLVAIIDKGRVIAEGDIPSLTSTLPGERRVQIDSDHRWSGGDARLDPTWEPVFEGRRLTVTLSDIGAQLPAVLESVRQAGTIERVETQSPSLEQVFLQLTGRNLRD